jgi:predicted Zn finger-like uncharacterized protein
MFTVCPKCALTLVVTATDLRVAQGYVRCGRCSNVFNALARLSEDRNAAAAAAASQGVPPSSTGVHPRPQPTAVPAPPSQPPQTPARPPLATGSFTYTRPPESPAPAARQPQQPNAPPARTQQPTAPPTRAPLGAAPSAHASPAQRSPAPPARGPQSAAPLRPQQPPASPPPSRPTPSLQIDDDDAIPEDALEFNPDADVNQVFVEPPPNPEWTAATGSFKAIVLKSEEVFHGAGPTSVGAPASSPAEMSPAHRPGSTAPGVQEPGSMGLSSAFSDDEFELDADFLSSTTEMRKLKVDLGDADADAVRKPTAPAAPAIPVPSSPQAPPSAFALHAPLTPSAPQAQQAPSARLAPRGPLPETPPQQQLRSPLAEPPSQPRSPFAEIQSQLRPSPTETPSRAPAKSPQPEPDEEEAFFEPQVVSKPPPRAAVKAFGLDAVAEPPPGRLAALARARVAPGAIELEPPPAARTTLLNSTTLWSAGAGALVILLAAQIVNHYRNDLAATAQFNKPITALYAALGVHLTPRWDLHAYDVRQLGASVDSGSAGQIMVRASVKNGAHQPQPMPLLRVTLQDRFGNRIAARDVPPGSYLPRATADTAFLPAGQRIDAEMAFVDPGSNAVGFEIDACLPAPAGGIACANDPTSR